ncbi:hypothetical protein K439DRAFT_1614372 [Ramaria rubella]|nr:hypothetical protein K439DRAFT_1614372 [Ramaria rubella]
MCLIAKSRSRRDMTDEYILSIGMCLVTDTTSTSLLGAFGYTTDFSIMFALGWAKCRSDCLGLQSPLSASDNNIVRIKKLDVSGDVPVDFIHDETSELLIISLLCDNEGTQSIFIPPDLSGDLKELFAESCSGHLVHDTFPNEFGTCPTSRLDAALPTAQTLLVLANGGLPILLGARELLVSDCLLARLVVV